jgi:hypothetical protein
MVFMLMTWFGREMAHFLRLKLPIGLVQWNTKLLVGFLETNYEVFGAFTHFNLL